MKAILVHGDEKNFSLEWAEVPNPTLLPHEVLIEVHATAVNRADLLQVRGLYPPPPGVTSIPGLEMAGRVVEVGESVQRWKGGERVCALLAGGGYAEKVAVHEEMLIALPEELSFEEGAAIPEAFITAYLNLFLEGGLKEGEQVLIHAGASGVGSAAIQLAKAVGAMVYTTVGSQEKIFFCEHLGADRVINYKTHDFEEELSEGVDLILDCVGGRYLEKNLRLLRRSGRMVTIGLLSGSSGTLDLGILLRKGLRIIGSTLRSRSLEEKILYTRELEQQFFPQIKKGNLKPIIDISMPIKSVMEAHDYMLQNKNKGKIILQIKK